MFVRHSDASTLPATELLKAVPEHALQFHDSINPVILKVINLLLILINYSLLI